MNASPRLFTVLAVAAFSVAACKSRSESYGSVDTTKPATSTTDTAHPATPAPAAAAPALTDANIVAILDFANESDSAMGALAVKRAKSADVKRFARLMMGEHHMLRVEGQHLAKKLNVTPQPPANFDMPDKQKSATSDLEGKSGADFDKAYIDHEVQFHQDVIQAAQQAESAAQAPQLKALIQKAAPVLQRHLDMAKQIQTKQSGTA